MRYIVAALLSFLIVPAMAGDVTIDGVPCPGCTVAVTTGPDPESTPGPGPLPTPVPAPTPPPSGDCVSSPAKVGSVALDLSSSARQVVNFIDAPSDTVTTPFRTTGNPEGIAMFQLSETTLGKSYRDVWVSACRAGTPVGPGCETRGSSTAILIVSQKPREGYCSLQPGQVYWFTVRNTTCQSPNCAVYLSIKNRNL